MADDPKDIYAIEGMARTEAKAASFEKLYGRQTVNEPNIQHLPRVDRKGGHTPPEIINLDYAQIELRVMAFVAGQDPKSRESNQSIESMAEFFILK